MSTLLLGDVLVSPTGTRWTVIKGSRLTSIRGTRKIQSTGGAVRWVAPHEVATWRREGAGMSAEWPEQIERAKERLRAAEDEMHDAFGEWRRSVVHRDEMKSELDALENLVRAFQ